MSLLIEKDTNTGSGGECRAALEEVRLSYKMGMKKGEFDALAKNMAYTEVRDERVRRCTMIYDILHSRIDVGYMTYDRWNVIWHMVQFHSDSANANVAKAQANFLRKVCKAVVQKKGAASGH